MKTNFQFNIKIFKFSFIIFPFLVVFGTIFHELGHIFMAKLLAYDTILHYGSMSWYKNGINGELIASKFDNLLIPKRIVF